MQLAIHPHIARPSCSEPARASGSSSAEEDDAVDQAGNRAVIKMQPSAKSQAQLAPQSKKLKPSAIYRKKKKHAGGQACCARVLICHTVIHTDVIEVNLMMDQNFPRRVHPPHCERLPCFAFHYHILLHAWRCNAACIAACIEHK